MKTYITILHHVENDDVYAVIIQGGRCFCYSHIGQHSQIAERYVYESDAANITEETVGLWNEIKNIYGDCKPVLLERIEFMQILNYERIKFTL